MATSQEGRHTGGRLTRDEYFQLFKLIEEEGPVEWETAREKALRGRHRNTVIRAYKIARALLDRDQQSLDPSDIQEIADEAMYGTIESNVKTVLEYYLAWRTQRDNAQESSHAPNETQRQGISPGSCRRLEQLMSHLWVPNADKVPLNKFLHEHGYHEEEVGGDHRGDESSATSRIRSLSV